MIIIFLGPPGAGKGTQANMTAKSYGVPHISTGEMFREEISSQSELGLLAKSYTDNGALVPDEVTDAMVKSRISRPDCEKGFLLDGYPRTISQAEFLSNLLKETNRTLTCVLNLEVPVEELVKRLTGRWSCPSCNSNYHDLYLPTKVKGICDNCGTSLTKRKDDEEETVRFRLKVYNENTYPLIEYYNNKKMLHDINGAGEINDVLSRIILEVDSLI